MVRCRRSWDGDADDVLGDVDDRVAAAQQEQTDRHHQPVDRPCGRRGGQTEQDRSADDDPMGAESCDQRCRQP
jgi:hypothetical protein